MVLAAFLPCTLQLLRLLEGVCHLLLHLHAVLPTLQPQSSTVTALWQMAIVDPVCLCLSLTSKAERPPRLLSQGNNNFLDLLIMVMVHRIKAPCERWTDSMHQLTGLAYLSRDRREAFNESWVHGSSKKVSHVHVSHN